MFYFLCAFPKWRFSLSKLSSFRNLMWSYNGKCNLNIIILQVSHCCRWCKIQGLLYCAMLQAFRSLVQRPVLPISVGCFNHQLFHLICLEIHCVPIWHKTENGCLELLQNKEWKMFTAFTLPVCLFTNQN